MTTAEQAFAATNPAMSQEEREEAADNILAGVAANEAYLQSRSEMEQLAARIKGGQVAEPHEVREQGNQVEASKTQAGGIVSKVEKVVGELSAEEKVIQENFPGETEIIKKRAEELLGVKL